MVGHRLTSMRPGINNAHIARIKPVFQNHFKRSVIPASAELKIPFLTIQNVFHVNLGMFPYGLHFLSQLLQRDYPRWLTYAHHILRDLVNSSEYLEWILLSGKCVCHTSTVLKKHNARVCGQDNLVLSKKYSFL